MEKFDRITIDPQIMDPELEEEDIKQALKFAAWMV